MFCFSRAFGLIATVIAAVLLLGLPACPSELGEQLLKDFRAQLTESQLEQLEKEGFVEVPISDLPDEMVERAVELSPSLFWLVVNEQKSQPEPSTVTDGALGLRKAQMDPEDPTLVECLEVRLSWHDPELDHGFTAAGVYPPEPYGLSGDEGAMGSQHIAGPGAVEELVEAVKGVFGAPGTDPYTELGEKLIKDFRARLTESELEQLEKEKRVEVPISRLPDGMVERAVKLSHSIFWVAINDQKCQPQPSTVTGGVLGLMKIQMDADDDSTLVDCLVVRLSWHDPELGLDGEFTVQGIYFPEPYSLPPIHD